VKPRARRKLDVPLVAAGVAAVVALLLFGVHTELRRVPWLQRLEDVTVDARFRWRGPRAPATDRVVIVGIDDKTRGEAPDLNQTRHGWAKLLRALAAADPAVVALDAYFSYPEVILPDELAARVRAVAAAADPAIPEAVRGVLRDVVHELDGDADVAAAVAEGKRVFLGANFWLDRAGTRAAGAEPDGLARGRHGEVVSGGGGDRSPARAYAVEFSMADIAKGAAGAGAINTFRDDDGVVRRLPLVIAYGPHHYMSLGLAAALVGLGAPGQTQYVGGADHLTAAGRSIPLGKSATVSLDFLGPDRITRYSAIDVVAGRLPPGALAGKLVFVGITYASYDKVATPLDQTADGVELHATLAENILTEHYLRAAGNGLVYAGTALLLLIVVASQHRRVRRRPWLPAVIAVVAIAGWVVAAMIAFSRSSVVVPIAPPAVLAAVVAVVALVAGIATEGREKRQLRSAFSHYVARSVVERIVADPKLARLGGERRELTVLFSDIRGFSRLAESLPPEDLASFLSEYLTPMTDLVLASEGTLDKYIGDAVMALWGAPVELPDHAARACDCALAMQARMVELNRRWQARGLPEVAIGIGINSGPMSVGNMGSKDRFDYTAIGDAVNLGARLEALTKEYGVDILVGAETAAAPGVRERFVLRELDLVRVKGRAGAAPVFEVLGRAGDAAATRKRDLAAWAAALGMYRAREFAAAGEAFAALAALAAAEGGGGGGGGDPAAVAFAARARALAADPPADDWDGVYEQRSK
jgi:adenylate cyclase